MKLTPCGRCGHLNKGENCPFCTPTNHRKLTPILLLGLGLAACSGGKDGEDTSATGDTSVTHTSTSIQPLYGASYTWPEDSADTETTDTETTDTETTYLPSPSGSTGGTGVTTATGDTAVTTTTTTDTALGGSGTTTL